MIALLFFPFPLGIPLSQGPYPATYLKDKNFRVNQYIRAKFLFLPASTLVWIKQKNSPNLQSNHPAKARRQFEFETAFTLSQLTQM
jgi:hypothetical protein